MGTSKDTLGTGSKEIAGILGGGINEDSLLLVEGESKSGKSILCQHIAYGTLHSNNDAVAYYNVDNSGEDIVEQMNFMSLDVNRDYATGRLCFYELESTYVYEKAKRTLQMLINHIWIRQLR